MISRTVCQRSSADARESIRHSKFDHEFHIHFHRGADNLAAVVVSNADYKLRLAFKIIALLLEKFRANFSGSSAILWQRSKKDLSFKYPEIAKVHRMAQMPTSFDKMSAAKSRIDGLQRVLYETMEGLLERDEKLDELVKSSNDLSTVTKFYYKDAKALKKCPCVVM